MNAITQVPEEDEVHTADVGTSTSHADLPPAYTSLPHQQQQQQVQEKQRDLPDFYPDEKKTFYSTSIGSTATTSTSTETMTTISNNYEGSSSSNNGSIRFSLTESSPLSNDAGSAAQSALTYGTTAAAVISSDPVVLRAEIDSLNQTIRRLESSLERLQRETSTVREAKNSAPKDFRFFFFGRKKEAVLRSRGLTYGSFFGSHWFLFSFVNARLSLVRLRRRP